MEMFWNLKQFWLFIAILLSSNTFFGQVKFGERAFESNNYEEAFQHFKLAVSNAKEQPAAHFGMARIFAEPSFSGHHIDSAYFHINKAINSFRKMPLKVKEKLQKHYSSSDFNKTKKHIEQLAYNQVIETNSLETYNQFLASYPKIKYSYKKEVHINRNELAYAMVSDGNNLPALGDFIKEYEKSLRDFSPAILQNASDQLFAGYLEKNGIEAFDQFAALYPNHPIVKSGVKARFDEALKKGTYQSYESFLLTNGNSLLAPIVNDSIIQLIRKVDKVGLYKKYFSTLPNRADSEPLWETYYQKILGNDFVPAQLDQFKRDHPNFPHKEWLSRDRNAAIGNLANRIRNNKNLAGFQQFIKRYPNFDQIDGMWEDYYQLFKATKEEPEMLDRFLAMHPDFPFPEKVKQDISVAKLEQSEAQLNHLINNGSAKEIRLFLEKFPTTTDKDLLVDRLSQWAINYRSEEDCSYFIQKFSDHSNFEQVFKTLYYLKTSKGTLVELEDFKENFPNFPDPDLLIADQQAFTKFENLTAFTIKGEEEVTLKEIINALAPRENAMIALRTLISEPFKDKDWGNAYEIVAKFKPHFERYNRSYNQLLQMLEKRPDEVNVRAFDTNVNSKNGDEFAPVLSANGNQLFFAGEGRKGNIGGEDIFLSEKIGGEWQFPEPVSDISSKKGNEAPETISTDGTRMIVFHSGQLKLTDKTAQGWTEMKSFPAEINMSTWQGDAVLSADGNALIFASNNPAGLGGKDIYVSFKGPNDKWQPSVNLGPMINTEREDRSPYLHSDMRTLYFSSDGHEGFGELDVFITKRLDDSWVNWSEPINLGYFINADGWDWGYKVTTDGLNAIFSKVIGLRSQEDIFICDLPKGYRPGKVATISGKLVDKEEKPVGADIHWKQLPSGKLIQVTRSDPISGLFFATLPDLGNYSYTIIKDGFFPMSGNVNLTDSLSKLVFSEPLELPTLEEMKSGEITLPLNNLFFDFGKYVIKPESYPELNLLADWIKQYDLQIELHGHTDKVGEDSDNLELSQNRVIAVKNYLLERGCNADKISAIGFGESNPVASNENSMGRAKNRRVEVKVIPKK